MSRRVLLGAALALVLTAGALVVVLWPRPTQDAGARPVWDATPEQQQTADPSAQPSSAPAGIDERDSGATAEPVELNIPSLDASASVVPVGVDADGLVEIPEDPDLVGWYEFGPAPGATEGSSVLAGHVDSAEFGAGALVRLREAEVDDEITVTTADGEEIAYRVVARERIQKQRLPLEELFARTGPPRLSVITCGGRFLQEVGGYEDNIVVTAVPAETR